MLACTLANRSKKNVNSTRMAHQHTTHRSLNRITIVLQHIHIFTQTHKYSPCCCTQPTNKKNDAYKTRWGLRPKKPKPFPLSTTQELPTTNKALRDNLLGRNVTPSCLHVFFPSFLLFFLLSSVDMYLYPHAGIFPVDFASLFTDIIHIHITSFVIVRFVCGTRRRG